VSDSVVELIDVSRTYGGTGDGRQGGVPVRALRDATFDIDAGEFVAIVGPSGSGKSTLLGLLGLLDRPTSGTIRLAGTDVTTAGDRRRTELRGRHIGFVFQQFHLIPHLSARANVEVALAHRGLRAAERGRRAVDALERVGLADRGDHRPAQLSGGEQQRVAVARALVTDPQLVLADEPTGALDTATAERVVELLAELTGEGRALIVVTHDLDLAARADRRITLRDGAIVADDRSSPAGRASGEGEGEG
jgi:putative ABC transport system ATP-binding protein